MAASVDSPHAFERLFRSPLTEPYRLTDEQIADLLSDDVLDKIKADLDAIQVAAERTIADAGGCQ